MKQSFQNSGNQAMMNSNPWETGTKVSPTSAIAYCNKRVSRLQYREVGPRAESLGRPKQPKSTGQSPKEERTTQREILENL